MTPPSDLLAGAKPAPFLSPSLRAPRVRGAKLGRIAPRERGLMFLCRHCERSEVIQTFSMGAVWIASTYAQMRFGGHGRRFAPRNDGVRCLKLENASTRVVLARARTHTAESFRGVQSQPIIAATTSPLCAAQRAVDGLAERFDLERLLQRRAIAIFFRKARGAVAGGEDEGAVARLDQLGDR
jgi:hypothetical protein